MGQLTGALGSTVYIDANIVIYAVEGFPAFQKPIRSLLQAMDQREISVVSSESTLAEALVKPLAEGNLPIQRAYRAFLESSERFSVIPISRPILESAAEIRAKVNVKLPEAIHILRRKQASAALY